MLFMPCFFFHALRLFIAALWSPTGKGLTSWLLFVMFNCVFVTFPCGILGQVWYLIVSIPDLCHLSYFERTQNSLAVRLKINYTKNYKAGFVKCNVLQLRHKSQINRRLNLGHTCAVVSLLDNQWPNGHWRSPFGCVLY